MANKLTAVINMAKEIGALECQVEQYKLILNKGGSDPASSLMLVTAKKIAEDQQAKVAAFLEEELTKIKLIKWEEVEVK